MCCQAASPKKTVFVSLSLKRDQNDRRKQRLLGHTVTRSYCAAPLVVLLRESNSNRPVILIIPSCIYLIQWVCGSTYVGRTERGLSVRAFEHIPKNLAPDMSKIQSSLVTGYLVDCDILVDPRQSVRVISHQTILWFAVIRRQKPGL